MLAISLILFGSACYRLQNNKFRLSYLKWLGYQLMIKLIKLLIYNNNFQKEMNALSVKALKKPGGGGGLILKVPLNFENKPWACFHSKVFLWAHIAGRGYILKRYSQEEF